MPSLQQIRQNAFVPYGTAGFASANNAAALPGPDLPPSGYPNFNYGGPTYGQGGNVSINDPTPGAGFNPNAGWTGRLPRYAAGGLPGLAIGGGVELYRRLFNHNTGNPASNMVGSGGRGSGSYVANDAPPSDAPPGGGSPDQNPFGGVTGNLSARPADTRLSGPGYEAASRAQNAFLMSQQSYGGAPNNPRGVSDEGHTVFSEGQHKRMMNENGELVAMPERIMRDRGVHNTFAEMGGHPSGLLNYPSAASLYQNPPASAGTAAAPLIAPTQPLPIGGGASGPFVGPLPTPPIPIGGTPGPFVGPLPYPFNQPPGFYGGPIRGK